jgi:hypothetical protein
MIGFYKALPTYIIRVTSAYGMRIHPVTGVKTFHYGIDLGREKALGEPIFAVADGVIAKNEYSSVRGYIVDVKHDNGYKTRYQHLAAKSALPVGTTVKAGDTLGPMGNTGVSAGVHLHHELLTPSGTTMDPYPDILHCQESIVSKAKIKSDNIVNLLNDIKRIIVVNDPDKLRIDIENNYNNSLYWTAKKLSEYIFGGSITTLSTGSTPEDRVISVIPIDDPDTLRKVFAEHKNSSLWWSVQKMLDISDTVIKQVDSIDDRVEISDYTALTESLVEGYNGSMWWTIIKLCDKLDTAPDTPTVGDTMIDRIKSLVTISDVKALEDELTEYSKSSMWWVIKKLLDKFPLMQDY